MSKIFTIRVGDRMPALAYSFPFPLTGAQSVLFSAMDAATDQVFIYRQPAQIANGTYMIEGVSTVLSPNDPKAVAFYPWADGDTGTIRKSCLGLFRVIWPGNLPETVPSEGYVRFIIGESF